jgi:enolase-phosphatase E1
MKVFLFDIEGTTSDINFVHKVLFPYSAKALESFILNHQTHPEVQAALKATFETIWDEQKRPASLYEIISFLSFCIQKDRKFPPLKILQGLIWQSGYEIFAFKGHVYSDVEPFWKKLKEKKKTIAIYSSGSVHAQKLIFKYSEAGDLTPFISQYFDTTIGHKREVSSYQNISQKLKVKPVDIHFFSDIKEELVAAQKAGLTVSEVRRDQKSLSPFSVIQSFNEVIF